MQTKPFRPTASMLKQRCPAFCPGGLVRCYWERLLHPGEAHPKAGDSVSSDQSVLARDRRPARHLEGRRAEAVSQPRVVAETQGEGSFSATHVGVNTRRGRCLSHKVVWKHKAKAMAEPQSGVETQGNGSVSATNSSGNTRQRQCLSHKQ